MRSGGPGPPCRSRCESGTRRVRPFFFRLLQRSRLSARGCFGPWPRVMLIEYRRGRCRECTYRQGGLIPEYRWHACDWPRLRVASLPAARNRVARSCCRLARSPLHASHKRADRSPADGQSYAPPPSSLRRSSSSLAIRTLLQRRRCPRPTTPTQPYAP